VTTLTLRGDARLTLARWLWLGAVACLLACGLSVAALFAEPAGQPVGGFTAATALNLIALLPEAVVMGTLLHLAGAAGSAGLRRSSVGRFVSIALLMLLAPFLSKDLGDAALVLVVLPMLGAVVGALVFRVWFGVALLRLRHQLGGMAAVLGWLELLAAASWLVFRVLFLAIDQPSALDRADTIRSLVATVACDLLLALLFLGVRDRLTEATPS
jgi:hypothetical protein